MAEDGRPSSFVLPPAASFRAAVLADRDKHRGEDKDIVAPYSNSLRFSITAGQSLEVDAPPRIHVAPKVWLLASSCEYEAGPPSRELHLAKHNDYTILGARNSIFLQPSGSYL